MQLARLLEAQKTEGVVHTVLCKGAGEFFEFPSGYELRDGTKYTDPHKGPPIIPKTTPDESNNDVLGPDDERSDKEDPKYKASYNYEPRSDSYWNSNDYLERPLRKTRNKKKSVSGSESGPAHNNDQSSHKDTQPEKEQGLEDDTGEQTVGTGSEEESDEIHPHDDPVAIPKPTTAEAIGVLPDSSCRLATKDDEKFELHGSYITALNMRQYFQAVLDSTPVKNAVKNKNNPNTGDKVNRVSIWNQVLWMCVKGHYIMLTWDTLIDQGGPFLHQIYLTSCCPEYIYPYTDDFRGGSLYKDTLKTFVECLLEKPDYINNKPIQLFEDTAIRSKIRRSFLRTDVEGYDLSCVSHVMLCTIYQTLVLNAVTQPDDRGDHAPDNELDIDTENKEIERFATLNTKRFFRCMMHKFDTGLRTLLKENIYEGNIICFDAEIDHPVISIDKVKLTIVSNTNTQSNIAFNHLTGFVQHRESGPLDKSHGPWHLR